MNYDREPLAPDVQALLDEARAQPPAPAPVAALTPPPDDWSGVDRLGG